MLKKISTILLIFIIISISSVSVFAGQTEDAFSSGIPVTNNNKTDVTDGGSSSTKNDTTSNTKNSTATAPSSTTSAAAGVTGNTAENAGTDEKKPDFGAFIYTVMEKGEAVNNGLDIIEITSPDKAKDSTYNESYVLSGNTKDSDVVVTIARYNEETDSYELIKNTDGESSWKIGSIRIFTKEIMLKKGINNIMIASYRSSQKEEATLDNVQFNCFTIEKLDRSIKEEIIKISKEAATNIGEGFKTLIDIFGKKQN